MCMKRSFSKSISLFKGCTAETFIRKDAHIAPIRMLFEKTCKEPLLGCKRVLLVCIISRYTAIGTDIMYFVILGF